MLRDSIRRPRKLGFVELPPRPCCEQFHELLLADLGGSGDTEGPHIQGPAMDGLLLEHPRGSQFDAATRGIRRRNLGRWWLGRAELGIERHAQREKNSRRCTPQMFPSREPTHKQLLHPVPRRLAAYAVSGNPYTPRSSSGAPEPARARPPARRARRTRS